MASPKTEKPTCTKAEYMAGATEITITIGNRTFVATPKEFSTGSVGFNVNDKVDIKLSNGKVVKHQLGINIIAVGSKEWEDGGKA